MFTFKKIKVTGLAAVGASHTIEVKIKRKYCGYIQGGGAFRSYDGYKVHFNIIRDGESKWVTLSKTCQHSAEMKQWLNDNFDAICTKYEFNFNVNKEKIMKEFKLGNIVRDVVTGFTGTAFNKTEFLNGNVQYNIQPKGENNSYPDCVSIDFHTLEFVDEGVAANAPKQVKDLNIPLGSEVEDITTGIKGIVTLKTFYLNGCISYMVDVKETMIKPAAAAWIDQSKLKVIGKGITKEYNKPEKNSDGITTGGAPMRNMFGRK